MIHGLHQGGILTAETTDSVAKIPMQFVQFPLQDTTWYCVKNYIVHIGKKKQI